MGRVDLSERSTSIKYPNQGDDWFGNAFSLYAVHKSTALPIASSVRLLKLLPKEPTCDFSSTTEINLFEGVMIKISQSFVGRKNPGKTFPFKYILVSGTPISIATFLKRAKNPSNCFPPVTALLFPVSWISFVN